MVMQAMVQVGDKWNLPELKGPPVRFVNIARAMRLKSHLSMRRQVNWSALKIFGPFRALAPMS